MTLKNVLGQKANVDTRDCESEEVLRREQSVGVRSEPGRSIALHVRKGQVHREKEMNAFTCPVQSIASQLPQPRLVKTVDRSPRYRGYFIESGAKAQASHIKTQRILKGAM